MFKVKREVEYTLLILNYLKKQRDFIPLSQVVAELNIPLRFLARISARLVKRGILESKEGRNGGYKISRDLRKISLRDIFEMSRSSFFLVPCLQERECRWERHCAHKSYFVDRLNSLLMKEFEKVSLDKVLTG